MKLVGRTCLPRKRTPSLGMILGTAWWVVRMTTAAGSRVKDRHIAVLPDG
jgi:hypothetical protein